MRREWFGVWEVRDYYTILEQRAMAGAKVTYGYILMVVAAAILATGGLLLNSPAVVIGSMCVAPFLGPSRAVCIGGLFRNRRIFLGGLFKQLFGLLIMGVGMAYLITTVLLAIVPGVGITPEILLRAMPTSRDVVLTAMVAITAGAAASLALSANPQVVDSPWGQVIDAMIGVEIAISLIPPASVVGIGLAFGRMDISQNALLLLIMNVLGLDIVGSMVMMALRGIRVHYLTIEKAVRRTAEKTLMNVPDIIPVSSTINVTLLSDTVASVYVTLRNLGIGVAPDSLAQSIATRIIDETGCRSEVTVEIIPTQTYSTL
ncbi:MAG: DUF389 domain-containing protein [Anaerolineales bacterium]|nr:MAG: DUF389 domain-containing protein [Anaerolineales bacterium]